MITYGTSVADTWPRLSVQADRILKGANPAEIPVEAITHRGLVINLATAWKIGATLPPDILRRADRVVE